MLPCGKTGPRPLGAHPVSSPRDSEPTAAFSCVRVVVWGAPVGTKPDENPERWKQGSVGSGETEGFSFKFAIRCYNVCILSTIWEEKIGIKVSKLLAASVSVLGKFREAGGQQGAADPHRWLGGPRCSAQDSGGRYQKQSADTSASAPVCCWTGGAAEHSSSASAETLEPPLP